MSRPPMLMHIRFQKEDRSFGLWLPLFLLLPLALVVLIILSPLILVALFLLWPSGWGLWALKVLKAAFASFCAMRGLEVDVQNASQHVYISVV
jgi:hypothetical protein